MTRSVSLKACSSALALGIALSACQPAAGSDPPPKAAPSPKPRVSDFSRPMTARGTEPFWALSIEGTHFRLSRPEQPELTAEAPGARISPGRASWTATTPDGQPMTVTLYVAECSDGMSDLRYPMAAEVALPRETLHGCAAKTAELPREGGARR